MKILTPENRCFEMNSLPEEIEDIRYCVMDVTDKAEPDFYFIPLVFIETFEAPSISMTIGTHKIEMPIDWHILIGHRDIGDLEFVPLTSINERSFDTILTNPLAGFTMDWQPIKIKNYVLHNEQRTTDLRFNSPMVYKPTIIYGEEFI